MALRLVMWRGFGSEILSVPKLGIYRVDLSAEAKVERREYLWAHTKVDTRVLL